MDYYIKLLILAACLGCTSALQAQLSELFVPELRTNRHNDRVKRLSVRGLTRTLTESQKCDKLMNAMQEVINARKSAMTDQLDTYMQGVLGSTGIDINDEEQLRESTCKVARINNLGDLAQVYGLPESFMRDNYHHFVKSVNTVRSYLSNLADTPHISSDQVRITKAIARFYDVYEEIGMLNLS